MSSLHWFVLITYFSFTALATLLALARRSPKQKTNESVWRKYPTYILINLCFIFASWSPPEWYLLTILLAVLGACASWEVSRTILNYPKTIFLSALTFILIILADFIKFDSWFHVWFGSMLIILACITLTSKPAHDSQHALSVFTSTIYFPLCLAAYIWLQQKNPLGFHAVFLYLVVATNDAFAQITGELFGKRQLTPHISPAKTIEGAMGGILFATAMGIGLSKSIDQTLLTGGMFGLALGAVGLTGDLIASTWKRTLGIKNYSTLLGAQGGVFDRFDSLIFSAPVFYILLNLVS